MVTGCIQQGVSSPEQPMLLGDAFSVAGDRVVLARDHEGIIVLEPWQLLAKYYSPYKYIMRQSINPKSRIFQQLRISRQRLFTSTSAKKVWCRRRARIQ